MRLSLLRTGFLKVHRSSLQRCTSRLRAQLVRRADLEAYLNDEYGINRIYVQDGHYSLPLTMGADGRPVVSSQRYFPAVKAAFFHADNKLGDGLWGDPPEVSAARLPV